MSQHYDKFNLYLGIERLRGFLELDNSCYPLDIIEICRDLGFINVNYLPFATNGLKAMAVMTNYKYDNDYIILRENQGAREHNFFCGHELIHLLWHRDDHTSTFKCYDKVMPQQDCFLEWQANEGCAELLVPYKMLLPLIKENIRSNVDWQDIYNGIGKLSKRFNVSSSVIENRFESLKYEIHQYCSNGVELDDIEILSARKLKMRGIDVKSINDIATASMIADCRSIYDDLEYY